MSEAKSSVLLSFLPFHDTYQGLFPLTSDVDTLVSRCEVIQISRGHLLGLRCRMTARKHARRHVLGHIETRET